MDTKRIPAGCACCPMNRRDFLSRGGAAAAGALAILSAPDALGAAEPAPRTRIRILYAVHAPKQPGPDWPNVGFDFVPVMDRLTAGLTERCKGFDFITAMANGAEQAAKVVEEDNRAGNIDGYLVFQMNCWNQVVQTAAATGKPVLYADFQYGGSGGFLVYTAGFLRGGAPNIGYVASSKLADLAEAVKCFSVVKRGGTAQDFVAATRQVRLKKTPGATKRKVKADDVPCLTAGECVRRLKECRILAVADENGGPAGERMGIPVQNIPFAEVNEAWKNADRDEARAVAERWAKTAASVKGVSAETLETSAAMYLAQKAVMKKHGANAITINCLGGFYGGHIHAYPCLGFHELLNDGLIGACECDVRSAATMVAMTTLTQGRPGYISDPVIDTSKRQIIYAHCVASNRAFGPQGKPNPFHILTHSEDRQGASVRSILPEGYMTTTVEFEPARKEVLFHQAVAVDNSDDDRACRTKLCAEPVGDVEKLFTQWDQWGWHRVTVYGDLKEPVFALADALGYKVVEEA